MRYVPNMCIFDILQHKQYTCLKSASVRFALSPIFITKSAANCGQTHDQQSKRLVWTKVISQYPLAIWSSARGSFTLTYVTLTKRTRTIPKLISGRFGKYDNSNRAGPPPVLRCFCNLSVSVFVRGRGLCTCVRPCWYSCRSCFCTRVGVQRGTQGSISTIPIICTYTLQL